eukprot:2134454-Rhodomonas_salina.1
MEGGREGKRGGMDEWMDEGREGELGGKEGAMERGKQGPAAAAAAPAAAAAAAPPAAAAAAPPIAPPAPAATAEETAAVVATTTAVEAATATEVTTVAVTASVTASTVASATAFSCENRYSRNAVKYVDTHAETRNKRGETYKTINAVAVEAVVARAEKTAKGVLAKRVGLPCPPTPPTVSDSQHLNPPLPGT